MITYLCIMLMLILVNNSDIVIAGAMKGLMLWYKNVLPILLPFMLISGIMVASIKSSALNNSSKSKVAVFTTVFLGVLCGYPLGAKTTADFVVRDIYDKKIGNILLPMCNNSSPMFISGYIIHFILKDSISFLSVIIYIYLPYAVLCSLYILLSFTQQKNISNISLTKPPYNSDNNQAQDFMLTSVIQITYVGIYIMLCSIITEFVYASELAPIYKIIISGVTELTRGISDINNCPLITSDIKTALILAVTSFGGISSILQTKQVIKNSGLSIVSYISIKLICALSTMGLCLLFV